MTINFNYFRTRPVRYAALFVSATAAVIATGVYFELSKSDWSGWVQAIGSVAALGVAIFVMSRQNQHSAELVAHADALSLRRRAETVSVMVESAYWQMENCMGQISDCLQQNDMIELNGALASTKMVMAEIRLRLTSIPIHDLGSPGMAEGLIRLTEITGNIQAFSDLWVGPGNNEDIARMILLLGDKARRGIAAFRGGLALVREL